jgi:hypothetical protein
MGIKYNYHKTPIAMKKIILFLFLLVSFLVKAQDASENFIVGILPIVVSDYSGSQYAAKIQSAIVDVITGEKRFTGVDRTALDTFASEKKLQMNENFIDGAVVAQGKSLGVQYLIQGNLIVESGIDLNYKTFQNKKNTPNSYDLLRVDSEGSRIQLT